MSRFRAVLFDVGGVLMRLGEPLERRRWEARLGLAEGDLYDIVLGAIGPGWAGGRTEEEIHERICDATGLTPDELPAMFDDFNAHEYLDPDLAALIRDLRPRYRFGIVSNAGPTAREYLVGRHTLDQLSDVIVISAEERCEKPDPRIYLVAAERLGVAPEECVFVDDKPRNCDGARAVGMTAVCCTSTSQTVTDLRTLLDVEDKGGVR